MARAIDAVRRSPLVAVVLAIAGVAIVVVVVRMLTLDWHPMGDYRTLLLRTSDVGGADTPLVGLYSRFDWNHPGPWVFWVLAAPFRLLGDDGALVGAVVVNVAAVAASIAVCARAGRRWVLACASIVALLCCGIGLGGLGDPWNAYLVVLPMFAMCVGAWRALDGSRSGALLAVVAGSFAAGSHFGSAPVVVAMVVVVAVALVWRAVRGTDPHTDRITLLWCAIAAAVMWLPAAIDQLVHSPGNLRTLARFVVDGGRGDTNGLVSGARIMARSLALPFDWITGSSPTFAGGPLDDRSWSLPVGLIALVVVGVGAWRSRRPFERSLCIVATVALVAEWAAMSRINGLLAPYLVRTTWAVAAFVWLAVVGIAASWVAERTRRDDIVSSLLAGAIGVVLVVTMVRGVDVAPLEPKWTWARADAAVTPPVLATIAELPGPVLLESGYGTDGAVAGEILATARSAGFDVGRPSWMAFIVGPRRTIDPATAASTVMVVSGDARFDFADDPTWHEIVTFDPLTAEQRAEIVAIEDRVASSVDVAGLDPEGARDARRTMIAAWKDANDYSHHPDAEYLRYKQLTRDTDVVAAFWRLGPL